MAELYTDFFLKSISKLKNIMFWTLVIVFVLIALK